MPPFIGNSFDTIDLRNRGDRTGSTPLNTTPPAPGWSLTLPFSLNDAVADLQQATQLVARLAQEDDGSASHAEAIRDLHRVVALISARITREVNPDPGLRDY